MKQLLAILIVAALVAAICFDIDRRKIQKLDEEIKPVLADGEKALAKINQQMTNPVVTNSNSVIIISGNGGKTTFQLKP